MNFITVEQNIASILGAAAAGRFRVIGYQSQSDDIKEYLDTDRLVRVFYSIGDFPKNAGGISGPSMHDVTYSVEIIVSKSAEGDLATLNNELSTPVQLQAALAGVKKAEHAANDSWNELFSIIYGILMDASNQDLDMPVGEVADRWIIRSRKDEPGKIGGLVMVSGTIDLEVRMDEVILGETGVAGDKIYDTVVDIDNDDNEQTGVLVDHTTP